MKRQIIKIDEDKCDGCGLCIPECKEGAIQLIEGKARLISDLFCDGLGACLGHCPQDAIIIEEREAEPYNERMVLATIGDNPAVLKAHLEHLIEHRDMEHYVEALEYLQENNIQNPVESKKNGVTASSEEGPGCGGGCPGSQVIDRSNEAEEEESENTERQKSELKQWPIQLHLVPTSAPYFMNQELVIMSTCGPLASANVHQDYIKDRALVVACPKLDYTEPYTEKLASIFHDSNTSKAIVVRMEVPCCGGLTKFAKDAAVMSGRKDLVVEEHVMSIDGSLKSVARLFSGVETVQN